MGQTPSHSSSGQIAWLYFKFDGRIDRAAYFLAGLLLLIALTFPFYRFTLTAEETGEGAIWAIMFWGMFFLSLWCLFALGVKRIHDIGRHGAFAVLCVLFPLPAFIVLSLWPGDNGPNAFGPRTNARGNT